ncbi:hypothetical protein GCM10020331_100310 [Ectobacillus funiculus]
MKSATSHTNVSDILKARLPLDGMIRVVNEDSHSIMTITKETEFTELTPTFKKTHKQLN